ncbi:MAG TPA: hypothetical protein VM680_07165 [Verrucomicrobiae bacterium]|nr:hypothetical protein [Verrucomicrobiae bacterium]
MRWRIEIFALVTLAGCATTPLPPPEMSADWKTLQGQAVWKPKPGDGIAGELLLATNSVGDFVIEFAKPPITIAHAQRSGDRWSFQFPAQKKSYSGPGKGPSRVIWLRVAPALLGHDKNWQATTTTNGWRIANNRGESLEGYFAP